MTYINTNQKFVLVPNCVLIFYYKKKNVIILKINENKRFLKLPFGLVFVMLRNKILTFIDPSILISKNTRKKLNNLKKTIMSLLKQFLIELQGVLYGKLTLVGVGFKVFKTNYNKILLFKLGFSHSIYFKLNFNIYILKSTKIFIIGNFYQKIINLLGIVKLLKIPEPYKGKGILVFNEKIKLKLGKKI